MIHNFYVNDTYILRVEYLDDHFKNILTSKGVYFKKAKPEKNKTISTVLHHLMLKMADVDIKMKRHWIPFSTLKRPVFKKHSHLKFECFLMRTIIPNVQILKMSHEYTSN